MADELKFAELEKSFSELKTQLAGESAARQAAEAQAKTLADQNTKLAERVTAMEKSARAKRFSELVDAPHAPWYGKPEGHLSLLETLADTFGEESEQFKAYVSQQQATAQALADSDLFKEHGVNRSGGSNDPVTRATQMANARAKEASIPFQDALNQIFGENPALYEEYRAKNTVKV